MSSRYTADGRRRSSMTHAARGHQCEFCPQVVYGNGGKVAHARAHVRSGEAVELEKWYGTAAGTGRLFLPAASDRIAYWVDEMGYRKVEQR